jgi:hypothetical protein
VKSRSFQREWDHRLKMTALLKRDFFPKVKSKIEKKYFEMIHKFRTAADPKERRSWRWIIRYLTDIHNIKVSYSYLIRCYEEILEEKSLDGSA